MGPNLGELWGKDLQKCHRRGGRAETARVSLAVLGAVPSRRALRPSVLIRPRAIASGRATPLWHRPTQNQFLETLGNVQPRVEAAWGVEGTTAEVSVHRQVAQDLYGSDGTRVCCLIACNFPQRRAELL